MKMTGIKIVLQLAAVALVCNMDSAIAEPLPVALPLPFPDPVALPLPLPDPVALPVPGPDAPPVSLPDHPLPQDSPKTEDV
ncbi:monocarboxylate transporter 8-like isoform X2 [Penaeus monodon]|uniref:monocarboxylate transporter 8-like isoform X2 n=1 Tax=Penaeus monodon TaxID=6687 RepID=UPI0018A76372|nr:monocarboxylate transporter 8-like isoform X2 [Penaeus monodon]